MKWISAIQRHLGWKLFLSYVLILIIGIVVLDTTAELQLPFSTTFDEHLILATLIGLVAAILASFLTTRRILQPIQAMMRASQRISAGDYHSRIDLPSQDELGALAESFNQMADTLDRTEHRRLELIGDVAHELRTPLASIKSSLEGLVDGVIPAEPETFLGLEREVSRMQRLVRDLEELSRAEAGQIRLELKPVAMTELIGVVAERLRSQFEDKDVTLRFDIPPNLPRVNADANCMMQVLLNLLGNALQYTPSSGSVTARAWCDHTRLYIAIQDTGIGIAPDHLPHLFERFYRVDKSRSRAGGGSGIGLTIAKHLIEAQGGYISATSPGPNQGSTFTIEMPIVS
jgi:signal transduction histidine kinase